MLIIFGTKVRNKVIRTLVFFCPGCGGDRQGSLREARHWFTLFFIPVIPLKRIGEVVHCDTCQRLYPASVLERPTTSNIQEVLHDAIRAVTVMVVATGDAASPTLRARAVESIGSIVSGYTDETLTTDLQVLDPAHAPQYVAPLADGLAPAGRERFLSDVVRVAGSDGPLTADQRAVVDECGRALELSPAHVTGIVAIIVSGASPSTTADGEAS